MEKEMKNRKGRREEGPLASCSAQPARPATGPASHRPAPPTRCSQPAAQPSQPSARTQAQQAGPGYRSRPRAQPRQQPLPLGPARQPCAVHPHAPLPFAAVAASGPRPSAIPCSSSPRCAQPSADRRPTASAERARGSRPSHGLAPLGAAPTPTPCQPPTPCGAARCARRDPQLSAMELEAPTIRAPALEP